METDQNPPEKLSKTLNRLLDRCENCGYGVKHKGHKWCECCIGVYYRKEKLMPEAADKMILNSVGLLYFDAALEHLDAGVREKLLNLETGQGVFIFGGVGVGKTYAMAALLRHYICEGYECKRINFDDFCVKIRSSLSNASKISEREITEPLKHIDKLFIDDLAIRSKQETDFAYVTLYSILNKRLERMLPTFISSNKNLVQVGQHFDKRIVSRLGTAEIIELTGKDRRQ